MGLNQIAAQEVPIEIRVVNPPTVGQLKEMEPRQMFWVRAQGYIGKWDPMACCKLVIISLFSHLQNVDDDSHLPHS